MILHVWASERQYLEHLLPIWLALDPAERGIVHVRGSMVSEALVLGVPRDRLHPRAPNPLPDEIYMVASVQDQKRVRKALVAYIEHGSGQVYLDTPHPSYSGSEGHDCVRLFICPSDTVAKRWKARYPDTPAVAVGCPKLDRWVGKGRWVARRSPTIAISFHDDISLCPETRWAFPHFDPGLPTFVTEATERGWRVLGHAHPRRWYTLRARWDQLGVEATPWFSDVLDRADVFVVDNSSCGWEAAAAGLGVVWLNSPLYRRDLHHGLRFWNVANRMLQVDEPEDLVSAIVRALAGEGRLPEDVLDTVYAHRDGRSAERAATAIREVFGG